MKWIRLFSVGVALLTIAVLLYVLGRVSDVPAWLPGLQRGTAVAGGAAFLIGLVGLVFGGRSSEPRSPS